MSDVATMMPTASDGAVGRSKNDSRRVRIGGVPTGAWAALSRSPRTGAEWQVLRAFVDKADLPPELGDSGDASLRSSIGSRRACTSSCLNSNDAYALLVGECAAEMLPSCVTRTEYT
jgi:hypothetical protein